MALTTQWMCISNKGFQTETQVWYSILPDGSFLMVQVIWSFLGCVRHADGPNGTACSSSLRPRR